MAFNTKVDVADTELEENEAVVAEAEDVELEGQSLAEAEAESDADEDDEEADESEDSLTYSNGVIEKIVAMATREVPHVLGMKGNLPKRDVCFGRFYLRKRRTADCALKARSAVYLYAPDVGMPFV